MDALIPPQTAEEYIHLVRQLAAITNKAMDYLDTRSSIEPASLERITQNIETIACLRGDSGIYETTRPEGLIEFQREMYAIEDQLRERMYNMAHPQ